VCLFTAAVSSFNIQNPSYTSSVIKSIDTSRKLCSRVDVQMILS
jgi:hypothetical protein